VFRAGKEFACCALNVGSKDVTVSINVLDVFGQSQNLPFNQTFAPGAGDCTGLGAFVGPPNTPLYCKITVIKGHSKDVRGSYCVGHSDIILGNVCEVSGEAR